MPTADHLAPPPTGLAPRWFRPALLVALWAMLLASIAFATVVNLDDFSTSARLAPALALTRGYPPPSLSSWHPPWIGINEGPAYPLMYLPCALAGGPVLPVCLGTILAHGFLLVPVALLLALQAARLGVTRGQALEMGVAPGLLLFGALMFTTSSVDFAARRVGADAPAFGWLLLACFSALRAEPPAPIRAGIGWTLAAGACAAFCVCSRMDALGSVAAVGLCIWWSAGWRRTSLFVLSLAVLAGAIHGWAAWRFGVPGAISQFDALARLPWYDWRTHASSHLVLKPCRNWRQKTLFAGFIGLESLRTYGVIFLALALPGYWLGRRPAPPPIEAATAPGTPTPAPMPFAPAGRIVPCLLFVALMGMPGAVVNLARSGGTANGWAFIAVPLAAAGALVVVDVLARADRVERLAAQGVLAAVAVVLALGSAAVVLQG